MKNESPRYFLLTCVHLTLEVRMTAGIDLRNVITIKSTQSTCTVPSWCFYAFVFSRDLVEDCSTEVLADGGIVVVSLRFAVLLFKQNWFQQWHMDTCQCSVVLRKNTLVSSSCDQGHSGVFFSYWTLAELILVTKVKGEPCVLETNMRILEKQTFQEMSSSNCAGSLKKTLLDTSPNTARLYDIKP